MIHPNTTVKPVSPEVGNGVFATHYIAKGTIVVVRDRFDFCIPRNEFFELPDVLRDAMETYMYHDKTGTLVLSWDHARYMNHNCCSNTLMTDYNLEIAVRDIHPGDEITTDYGLLNVQEPYEIYCGCVNCRKQLSLDDIDLYADAWDNIIYESLLLLNSRPQPLLELVSEPDRARLESLKLGREHYASVQNLKFRADR